MTPLPTKLQICFVWQAPQGRLLLFYVEHLSSKAEEILFE